MTERTGDPDACELASVVDLAHHADDGIELEQRQRHGGIVQIDLARLERPDHRWRERAHVDLEPDRQRGRRAHRLERIVHPQEICPELFVTEGVETKDGLAIL